MEIDCAVKMLRGFLCEKGGGERWMNCITTASRV